MWAEGVYAPLMSLSDASRASGSAAPRTRSPLLTAVLAVVPPSATAADICARFAGEGAHLELGVAKRLLGELARLGLVRASRRDDEGAHYVVTSLGQRAVEAAIHGDAAIPLEELERLRTDLLSTIAHELRTPADRGTHERRPAARPAASQPRNSVARCLRPSSGTPSGCSASWTTSSTSRASVPGASGCSCDGSTR